MRKYSKDYQWNDGADRLFLIGLVGLLLLLLIFR